MKYILLSLILLIFSCSRPEQKLSPSLLLADSLLQANQVDSALAILQNISPKQLQTPASHARYALLMTQANDKNYITHTDDSLIRIAVDYYDSTNDIASQAKAHYYLGRVYQDMNCITDVVREFLTALPLAEKMNDSRLMCLIYGNLGYVFWGNGLFDEADSLYRKDISLARIRKDSLLLASALTTLSKICMDKGEEFYSEAEKCLNEANVIIKMVKRVNKPVRRQIMASLGYLYERTARPYEAISIIKEKMVLLPDEDALCSDYLFIGSAYFEAGLTDSAKAYLNKSLYSDNFGVIAGAYMRLAEIANIEGKERDSLYYKDKYRAYNDSVVSQEVPVEIISLSKDFVHTQMVQQYKVSLTFYQYLILGVIISLFFIILLYLYKRRLAKRESKQLFMEYEKKMKLLSESEQALGDKENEIHLLKLHLTEYEGDMKKQLSYNNNLNELIKQKNEINQLLQDRLAEKDTFIETFCKKKFDDLIKETSIYHRLLLQIKGNQKNPDLKRELKESEWDELKNEINKFFSGFDERLCHKYKALTDKDIRFCYLIKVGFSFKEMQYIYPCALDTLYKHKANMLERMKVNPKNKLKDLFDDL